jgi:hypothetical protein
MVNVPTLKQIVMFSEEYPCAKLKITTFNPIIGSNGGLTPHRLTTHILHKVLTPITTLKC